MTWSNASDSQGIREAAAEATRAFMTCTSRVGKTTRLLALSIKVVIYLFVFTGHWPATESVYFAIEHGDRNLCTASIRSSAEGFGSTFVHFLQLRFVNMPICCSRSRRDPRIIWARPSTTLQDRPIIHFLVATYPSLFALMYR